MSRNPALSSPVWPGDFNGDGKTDLIASAAPPKAPALMVAIGDGTGSFGTPIQSAFEGAALAVGDFNGDGKLDAIAASQSALFVLPGNGNGTFATARKIADDNAVQFAVGADLDGDGKRDLIVSSEGAGGLRIHPGNGDFTFDPPIPLPAGPFPHDAIVVDLNGDGDFFFDEGDAEVLFGRGDGTFTPFVQYPVLRGAWPVVVGDFNRDGISDIATANRSAEFHDDCGPGLRMWDSVSILTGRGGGTFNDVSSFSLGDQNDTDEFGRRFRNSVLTLNTSDLDGDRATDLIASQGAILMNVAPRANRAPVANAGPDQVLVNARETRLLARATDPDSDVLAFHWVDETGRRVADIPNPCLFGLDDGNHTFTLTVDDGHGLQSRDSVVVTVRSSTDGHGVFADGSDIGAVGAAGRDSFDGSKYTVTGSGADIWGTADEFRYVWEQVGIVDLEFATLVESVQQERDRHVERNRRADAPELVVDAPDRSRRDEPSGRRDRNQRLLECHVCGFAAVAQHDDRPGSGSASTDGATFFMSSRGRDIWDTADDFQYMHVTFSGDVTLRLASTASPTSTRGPRLESCSAIR